MKRVFGLSMILLFLTFMLGTTYVVGAKEKSEEKENSKAREHYEKGRKAYLLLSFEDAIDHYNEAIEADPTFAPAYAGIGQVYSFIGYFQKEDVEDYEDTYNKSYENMMKALQLNSEGIELQRALALSYLHLDRYSDAQVAAERAIGLDPNDAESHYVLWAAIGRDPESPLIAKALELDPKLVIAHIDLGNTYFYYERDYKEAETHYRRAVEVNSDLARAHACLGNSLRFLASTLREQSYLDEAISEYKKAIKLDSDLVPAYVNLGVALFYKGEFEESVEKEKEALSLNSNYPDTYYHLGRFHEIMENTKEAVANYQTFIALVSKQDRYAAYLASARQSLAKLNGGMQ